MGNSFLITNQYHFPGRRTRKERELNAHSTLELYILRNPLLKSYYHPAFYRPPSFSIPQLPLHQETPSERNAHEIHEHSEAILPLAPHYPCLSIDTPGRLHKELHTRRREGNDVCLSYGCNSHFQLGFNANKRKELLNHNKG